MAATVAKLGEVVAVHEEKITNLCSWQKDQNGSIREMRAEIKKIYLAVIGLLVAASSNLLWMFVNSLINP